MARLASLHIKGYRSINDEIEVRFPTDEPVVLIGENNAGKTNILRALDLILGESWPGSKEPEDHDFWGRNATEGKIQITVETQALFDERGAELRGFQWSYDPRADGNRCDYEAISSNGNPTKYIKRECRDQCICVWIGSDMRLSYHLGYSTKWTLLSKLMRRFHSSLVQDDEKVSHLKETFETIKETFLEVPEFAGFVNTLAQQSQQMFGGMSYGLQVDFSAYDPSRYFHSLQMLPYENGEPRTFEELGSGQEQVLALAFVYAYAKAFFGDAGGIVLAIDEPEAHLHPLAQEWLAKHIRRMAKEGIQIVISTHSPHFVDLLGLEGIVLVRKDGSGATKVRQLSREGLANYCLAHGSPLSKTSAEGISSFYAQQSTLEILNGFFAKKVILVEGQTEQLALPVYLRKVDIDVTARGIAVIPVWGKGNLAKWWRLFTAYGIPTYVVFDNDSEDDSSGKKRVDLLSTLGVNGDTCGALLETSDWVVQDAYSVFGQDFEETMRAHFHEYASKEQAARAAIGDSKPIVARYVAEELDPASEDDGWGKFKRLGYKVLCMGADDRTLPD